MVKVQLVHLSFITPLSIIKKTEDSMAGLREVKFRAFIYNEKPGRYIQVVIQEAGNPGKGTPKQSKLSSLSSGSFSKPSRAKSREGLYTKERTMRLVTRGKRQGNHTRLKS